MGLLSLPSTAFPLWVLAASVLVYCIGGLLLKLVEPKIQKAQDLAAANDGSEKGTLHASSQTDAEEEFQLEKRAFLSKTWLFICHSSRFARTGDYHTFDIAGISFFVVLGRDKKLRAFHNVCRHRAYQVVRKSCGNSNRFSCKYHGWQYDDHGMLVKAPKFENMPGFVPWENGLFEVKLILTEEGLVFVNFDSSTKGLPFARLISKLPAPELQWKESFVFSTDLNWKNIAREFVQRVTWSQATFGWAHPWRKQKLSRQLGPLSILRELEQGVWCTLTALPIKASKTDVICDVFGTDSTVQSGCIVQKWKALLEKEVATFSLSQHEQLQPFVYECGGRSIELSAILDQQSRLEAFSGTRTSPAFRFTGTANDDFEAEALANTLDKKAYALKCSLQSNCSKAVEW